jgi:hypothetical protein
MRIEQDLRIVIKAAANASKKQDRSKSERVLIEEWMKKYPAKAAKARALAKKIVEADMAERKTREQLEKQFGLNPPTWSGDGEFRLGDENIFQKQGGEIGLKRAQFSEDQVITEYAGAATKQAAEKVLQRYGIVWK